MPKLGVFAAVVSMAVCVGGCAEFRHDSASFGGYFLTSLVEHVGHRLLTVERVYLTDKFVIAEARLTRPMRQEQVEFVGTRFLVASRAYVDAQVKHEIAQQKRSQLYVPVGPFIAGDVKQLGPDSQGWMLWPETLGAVDEKPSVEELLQLLQGEVTVKHSADKVPYRIEDDEFTTRFSYPQHVDTSSFWQEHEYLVYRPVPTTVFKCVVVPPAMIIDTATLPVVGIIYLSAMLNYAHGHGP